MSEGTKIVFDWKEGEPADLAFIRAFSELVPYMTWREAQGVADWMKMKASDPKTKFRYQHETMSRPDAAASPITPKEK